MRLWTSPIVIAALMSAAGPATAKECVEPYGKLVEVSPSVYEVRLKPECEGRESAAPSKAAKKDDGKAKAKTSAVKSRSNDLTSELLAITVARREDEGCTSGIGQVTSANDTEIVVGFRKECKHLAAASAPRSTAASFFSDFFFDEVFEEEITPRRNKKKPQKRGRRCDEAGVCTAMAEPPRQSLIKVASRKKARAQSLIIAEAAQLKGGSSKLALSVAWSAIPERREA